MSYWSFSQGLKPIVQQIDKDTFFCFALSQSRKIAQLLEKGFYKDSIASFLISENALLYQSIEKQDQMMALMESKAVNLENINKNQDANISLLEKTLIQKNRKIKRFRFQKRLMGIGLVTLSAIVIMK